MATILDVSFLSFFLPAFTFLFIVVLFYAMLQKTKIFGGKTGLDWVAALSVGVIVLFSGKSIELINFFTPWMVVIAVFLILLFVIFMFLGHGNEDAALKKDIWPIIGGQTTVFIVAILILVIGISNVFGPVFSPYEPGGPTEQTIGGEAIRTVFHPRILGGIFIMIIAAFAVQKISESSNKPSS